MFLSGMRIAPITLTPLALVSKADIISGMMISPIGGPHRIYSLSSLADLRRKIRELLISAKKTGLDGCQINKLVKVCSEISGGYLCRYSMTRLLSARVNDRISGII